MITDDNCAWNGPQYNGTAEDVHYAIEWVSSSSSDQWVTQQERVHYCCCSKGVQKACRQMDAYVPGSMFCNSITPPRSHTQT